MKTKTVIVILNWNGSGMLRQFLPFVIRYSSSEDTLVYVADNGSTDDSLPVLESRFPEVNRIVLDRNYGFADGYNLALKQIDAEYYVLLNSDVEVTEGWLSPLINYLDMHPDVAACQPKIRSWRNKDYFEYAGACGGFIDRFGYPFCRGRVMGVVEKDNNQYQDIIPVFWASGASLVIRSAEYHKVGGLDGRFFAHMEEIDLCWRLINSGKKIVCLPQSTVYHVGAATLKKENPQKTFLNFRNNLVMLYKNLPENEITYTMGVRRILDYMAATFFFIKGQFPNARAVFRARKAFNSMQMELREDRNDRQQRKSLDDIPGLMKKSILAQYYLRGKKYFSRLKSDINLA